MKIKNSSKILQYLLLVALLFLSFVPILMMISMSLKNTARIYGDFWSLPIPPELGNYTSALSDLVFPAFNTIYVCIISIFGVLLFSSMSSYAFARIRFFGKKVLFYIVLSLMMIPGILMLTPNFILANQLGLRDSLNGLAIFYIASGQVFAIFLLTSFFESQPESLFEAARIEGATELKCLWNIALPIARPILMTLAIMNFLTYYNDLIWPMLMIVTPSKETLMVALQHYSPHDKMLSRPDVGIQAAGYAFAAIPLFIVFTFGMKYYIQGITSGAIKG